MTRVPGWTTALLSWYETAKRDLPWRRTSDPYKIWISEIMLQQTRVEAVIAYYKRFLSAFPTVCDLASAPEDAVLKAWEGLGYYSRARNMHRAAKTICETMGAQFPTTAADLRKLPGIGDYTAGAIASISFGEATPAIDGNVKRVTSRLFGLRENINRPSVLQKIREALTEDMPAEHASGFNQALMELGALVCIPRRPRCEQCAMTDFCDAYAAGDADSLPVVEAKKPPTVVDVAVCLLTWEDQILIFKRTERLLHGLYVFALAEDTADAEAAEAHWQERGLSLQYQAHLGSARHVFTHRVWEMNLLHFLLLEKPDADFLQNNNAMLVEFPQLKTLPLPTAMKAAKEAALGLFD